MDMKGRFRVETKVEDPVTGQTTFKLKLSRIRGERQPSIPSPFSVTLSKDQKNLWVNQQGPYERMVD